MQPSDKFKEYCTEVCNEIRWKKAKPMVFKEIENHLCDKYSADIAKGCDESTAAQNAVIQMGNAAEIGQQLDKTHKPRHQWLMLALAGCFMLLGMLANYYLSLVSGGANDTRLSNYLIAAGLLLLCYFLDFSLLAKFPKAVYFIVLAFIAIVVFPADRIDMRLLGLYNVPLTYLSLVFPMVFALILYSERNKGIIGIAISAVYYLPFALYLMLTNAFAGLVLYTACSAALVCFAVLSNVFKISKVQKLAAVIFAAAAAFAVTAVFIGFSNQNYLNDSAQAILSNAAWVGRGVMPKAAEFLIDWPQMFRDYALLYMVYEKGIALMLFVILLVALFSVFGILKAIKQKSTLGSLVALAAILTFTLQAVIYIFNNLGYRFDTLVMPLPFLSFGNLSLFINASLTGFMLSVFRTGDIIEDLTIKGKKRFVYKDGVLSINIK